MFSKMLHANDGSEHAFHALAIAKQNNSDLHTALPGHTGSLSDPASLSEPI
jgi:hypothetical protein